MPPVKLLVSILFMLTENPDQYLALPPVKLLVSMLFMLTKNPDQYLALPPVKLLVSMLFMLTTNADQYLALPIIHQQPRTVMSIQQSHPSTISCPKQEKQLPREYHPQVHSNSNMNPLIGQPSCPGNLYDYDVVPNLDSGSNLDSADAREAKAETEGETDLGQAHAHMNTNPSKLYGLPTQK